MMAQAQPQYKRVYVQVDVEFSPEGRMLPRALVWQDGKRYEIDRVLDGEFGEFELSIYEPYSDEAILYVSATAPAAQSEGKWEFYLGAQDGMDTVSFYLDFGNVDGQDEFYAHLIVDEETLYINYEGANGVGRLSAGMTEDGKSLGGFSATVEVAEDDGAWLPGKVGATVDLLTIDDAQIEKASNEAMILLMNALTVMASANETVASLLGSMM